MLITGVSVLEFEEEAVEFKFAGEIHKVLKPNNGQIKKYTKDLEASKTDEEKEKALVVFLETLGLKAEVFDKLNPVQAKRLLGALYEQEKN